MKYIYILLILGWSAKITLGQSELSKLFGSELVQMKAASNYTWAPEGDAIFHPSWTYKGDTVGASNKKNFYCFVTPLHLKTKRHLNFFIPIG